MDGERDRKAEELKNLRNIITQWNANRLDLFALSEPNEDLEFHGVMRFYFQDAGQKVATKCIRVASSATTRDVIQTLIEKFRPDIRMLFVPEYGLYEIHENGEERKLNDEEQPLLVQLKWHKDDREGRFLLRRMDEKTYIPYAVMDTSENNTNNSFIRKLSRREKKEKKKKEKRERLQGDEENKDGIAERLYSELPETSFTRSISNPEAVMRRKRQQKLEKKLQLFGQTGADAGGTLKIYGESLNKDVPYKTLLLSTNDTASNVVKEVLEKYGREKEDPLQYCLVQVIIPTVSNDNLQDYHSHSPSPREYILDDDDCPLIIDRQFNTKKGSLSFHIKRRPADYQPRKRKKKQKHSKDNSDTSSYKYEDSLGRMPYLLELNPDGSEILHGSPKKHRLFLNVTEVGSERSSSTGGQYLQLFGPSVHPRHCVIAHTEGIVTVTPTSRDAETYVNGIRIFETTILQHGMVVRFGKMHTFCFIDPTQEQKHISSPDPKQSVEYSERTIKRDDQLSGHQVGGYETTFDAEGNVETISTHSKDDRISRKSDDAHSHRSFGRESSLGRGSYDRHDQRRGNDPILPAVLEFWEDTEDAFLGAITTQLDQTRVQFKLAPTYTLYMAARYRASTFFRPECKPEDRAMRLTFVMNKVSKMIHQVIQDRYRDTASLAFWLANGSELLHFLKQDRHLSAYTLDPQDMLAESVQLAFRSLVTCLQAELHSAMPVFIEDQEDGNEEDGTTGEILAVLSNAMSLLRRCRVNAALTIQLFSQLFHFINMWLFNKLVSRTYHLLCTRAWGIRLKRRLSRVEAWAEKQGLELAADCHLNRIVQAAKLLQASKGSPTDIANISSSCFKLNSLQLRILLEKYQPEQDEPHIPQDLIESVVKVAENTADELARSDGREVKLEEDADLQLPFLLPEDGYSCDIVRGVPAGLQEFLQPLVQAGLCRLTVQTTSSGYWTIYMTDQDVGHHSVEAPSPSGHSHSSRKESEPRPQPSGPSGEPEVVTMMLQKTNSGMGLSIVAVKGATQEKLGIYIKSVVKGGAADQDGRLQAGDQLLKVDGQSLVGISQEKAAELMTRTGPVVTLEVAKQAVVFHGLAALLTQPSPVMPRGPRHLSERDIPSRVQHDRDPERYRNIPSGAPHMMPVRIQGSKSVPSLATGHPPSEPLQPSPTGNLRPHDVYNPGYSRTSSTTSIPKATEFLGSTQEGSTRSRSTSNLQPDAHYDGRQYNGPVPGQGGPPPYSHVNRPTSQPNLLEQQRPPVPEERHYQNISMYQHQNNQIPAARPSPQPPNNLYPQQGHPPRVHHGSYSSLHRSEQAQPAPQSPVDRNRPLSTLVSSREQEQYANSVGFQQIPPSTSTHRTLGRQYSNGPPDPFYEQKDSRKYGHYDQFHPQSEPRPTTLEGAAYPEHYQGNYTQMPPPHNQSYTMDSRQRDLLRQEAKMEEMQEEVRRREERELMQQQARNTVQWNNRPGYMIGPGQRQHSVNQPINRHHNFIPRGPPQPAPKPQHSLDQGFPVNKPQRSVTSGRQPLNGHSWQQPPPQVSYRYGAAGYPPPSAETSNNRIQVQPGRPSQPEPKQAGILRGQTAQHKKLVETQASNLDSQQPLLQVKKENNLVSPSPWDREAKENMRFVPTISYTPPSLRTAVDSELKQREERARRARDDEIRELESLPSRNPRQEERLRALRLEQEFQRRAEEVGGDDDDDDEDDLMERAENRERMLRMQNDLELARQRRLEWEKTQLQHQQQQQQQLLQQQKQQQQARTILSPQEEWSRRYQEGHHYQIEDQGERLRHLRLEETNRKREFEAAKEAEERLLQEARRRQHEQDLILHQHPSHILDPSGQNDVPPPLPTSPPPLEPYSSSSTGTFQYSQASISSGAMRLDQLLHPQGESHQPGLPANYVSAIDRSGGLAPPVPERKSSFEVTGQFSNNVQPTIQQQALTETRNGNQPHAPKKVSFHEPTQVLEPFSGTNGSQKHLDHPPTSLSDSYTLDDIDEVLKTPQNPLPRYEPGSTPGVIGAQEFYRDPRQRIQAERNNQQHYQSAIPEKLTFREKMKMFAMDVGQVDSPKERIKISKAQREIEGNINGT
ncbi:afadin-like isoform X2 [Limulus polyphemus]|uniref:Afadin-like isoform X2 n=1 Tax=Limulus polyphemus TaxID=6850 RepID=A0ABM1TM84_LIMPO|nr:afadin-like isoform X2 [Limulus polyphemus]